jgi:hypothetical protein
MDIRDAEIATELIVSDKSAMFTFTASSLLTLWKKPSYAKPTRSAPSTIS